MRARSRSRCRSTFAALICVHLKRWMISLLFISLLFIKSLFWACVPVSIWTFCSRQDWSDWFCLRCWSHGQMKERSSSGLLFSIQVFDFRKGRLEAACYSFLFSTVINYPATLGSDLYGGFSAQLNSNKAVFRSKSVLFTILTLFCCIRFDLSNKEQNLNSNSRLRTSSLGCRLYCVSIKQEGLRHLIILCLSPPPACHDLDYRGSKQNAAIQHKGDEFLTAV